MENPDTTFIPITPPYVPDDLLNLTDTVLQCQESLIPTLLHTSLAPAMTIVLLLSFLQKRKNRQRCCWGRPGFVAPINLLDQYENRWTYGAVYGAIPNLLISVFLGFDGEYFLQGDYPTYLKSLYTIAYVQMVGLSFFPLFACLNTEFKLTGSLIGFVYSLFWFVVKMKGMLDCIGPYPQFLENITLVINLPSNICLGIVVIRYLVVTIENIRNNSWSKYEDVKLAPEHMLLYTKRLLARPSNDEEKKKTSFQMVKCKIHNFVKAHVYDRGLPFKYSPRIICVFAATVMCTYLLGSIQFYLSSIFLNAFQDYVIEFNNITDGAFRNRTLIGRNIETIYYMVEYSWLVPSTLVTCLFAFGLIRVLINYRKHTLMLYKGDTSFIPESYIKGIMPNKHIANTPKFAGYQIAYMLWAQILFTLVGFLFVLLFCFIVILPPIDGNFEVLSSIVQVFGIPLVVSMGIFLVQEVAASVFFTQGKLNNEDSAKPLALDNLRAFRAWDYFMFLNNITTGLISCLFRVVKSLFIGLLYLSRMDRSVLMAGFENLDTGFKAYIGMMMVERYNNHPVLRTFCQLTAQAAQKNNPSKYGKGDDVESEYGEPDETELEMQRKSTRAVTKWHLAYTLINNPKLKDERHHQLERPEESEKFFKKMMHKLTADVADIKQHFGAKFKNKKSHLFKKDTASDCDSVSVNSNVTENDKTEKNAKTAVSDFENTSISGKTEAKTVTDIGNNADSETLNMDQASTSTSGAYSNSSYQTGQDSPRSSRTNSLRSTSSVIYVSPVDSDAMEITTTL